MPSLKLAKDWRTSALIRSIDERQVSWNERSRCSIADASTRDAPSAGPPCMSSGSVFLTNTISCAWSACSSSST